MAATVVVCNQWTLTAWLSPDGMLSVPSRVAIWVTDGLLLLWAYLLPRWVLARKMLLAAGAAILAYLLIEIVCLSTGILSWQEEERHQFFHNLHVPDDHLGYRPKPNLQGFHITWMNGALIGIYDTDNYGFRNVGRDYAVARIYMIGDSFTWGSWVSRDQTFAGVVERTLGEPVIALGAGGYGPAQYEVLLRDLVLTHRPQLVALCLVANDLGEVPTEAASRAWFSKSRERYPPVTPYRRMLLSRLVYRLGAMDFHFDRFEREAKRAVNGLMLYPERGASPRYLSGQEYVAVEQVVGRMIEQIKQRGVHPLLCLLPSKESVHRQEYMKFFAGGADYLRNEDEGFKRLCRLAQANEIPCLDLTQLFRKEAVQRQLYFERDPHWNPEGHALAATRMLQQIRAELATPGSNSQQASSDGAPIGRMVSDPYLPRQGGSEPARRRQANRKTSNVLSLGSDP